MFVAITAFLAIVPLIFAEDHTENTILAANIYDDAALKDIQQSLKLMLTTIENLRLRIDSQNLIMYQQQNEFKKDMDRQITKQQNELQKYIDQLFAKHQNEFKEDMVQQFTEQQNESKKDMEQQLTKQQSEFKKYMDQQFTKQQNESKKDMDQQFTKQQNEFQKDMDRQISKQPNEFQKGIDQIITKQHNELKKDMEQQFTRQQNNMDQQFTKQQSEFKAHMDQQFTKQQNELKKDMVQQFTEQQNKFKKDMEQQFTKQENNMGQRFTKQQNEFKKGFEDLKLAFTPSREPLTPTKSKDANLIDIIDDFTNQHQKICHIGSITIAHSLPANCVEALEKSGRSGVYKIKVPASELEPFYVYCLSHVGSELEKNIPAVNSSSGAWTVVQRRQDGTVDFFRNWTDYQRGFGNLETEFFIGLDKLHALTQSALHELWIQMEDFEGNKRWAKYSRFAIGGRNDDYTLKVLGAYIGNAGDSLSVHANQKWTTKDKDNDRRARENCAVEFKGAWWYKDCHESNLNGLYFHPADTVKYAQGINWKIWHGWSYSLKYVHMAIRPVQ